MIHDERLFIAFPANWKPPFFQIGEYVRSRTTVGTIVGFCYYTPDQADIVEAESGWWYWVFETKTLKCGFSYAEETEHHESLLQRVPSRDVPVLKQSVSV